MNGKAPISLESWPISAQVHGLVDASDPVGYIVKCQI